MAAGNQRQSVIKKRVNAKDKIKTRMTKLGNKQNLFFFSNSQLARECNVQEKMLGIATGARYADLLIFIPYS